MKSAIFVGKNSNLLCYGMTGDLKEVAGISDYFWFKPHCYEYSAFLCSLEELYIARA